ncbi:MAG: hypothetical protein IJS08_07075, partial [Victivallales bacterium]|nr:hypothetical protein [Victivallales bacterium]
MRAHCPCKPNGGWKSRVLSSRLMAANMDATHGYTNGRLAHYKSYGMGEFGVMPITMTPPRLYCKPWMN